MQVKLCDPCLSAFKWFVYHARCCTSALLYLLPQSNLVQNVYPVFLNVFPFQDSTMLQVVKNYSKLNLNEFFLACYSIPRRWRKPAGKIYTPKILVTPLIFMTIFITESAVPQLEHCGINCPTTRQSTIQEWTITVPNTTFQPTNEVHRLTQVSTSGTQANWTW